MSSETGRLRILATGSCDGLEEILEGLAGHAGLDLVGVSENVADATGALAGGHLSMRPLPELNLVLGLRLLLRLPLHVARAV